MITATGEDIKPGDKIIGFHSSGVHSNCFDKALTYIPEVSRWKKNKKYGLVPMEELLKPTALYGSVIQKLINAGIHPTGIVEVIDQGLKSLLYLKSKGCAFKFYSFPCIPNIFRVIRAEGKVDLMDMFHNFNMGIGLYLIVSNTYVPDTIKILDFLPNGFTLVGEVISSEKKSVKWQVGVDNLT